MLPSSHVTIDINGQSQNMFFGLLGEISIQHNVPYMQPMTDKKHAESQPLLAYPNASPQIYHSLKRFRLFTMHMPHI